LTLSKGSGQYAIAFDLSYIRKSGNHTPAAGYFWSGFANRAILGLEIVCLATINIDLYCIPSRSCTDHGQ